MPSTLMLLTYPFRPDPRVLREARSLHKRGFDVHLIAWDREGGRPTRATEHGIEVIRLGPRCIYRSSGKVISRLPRFWVRALRASKQIDFDVVHCHDFDTLPLGLVIGRLRGKPVLYDAHEVYSAMIRKDVGELSRMVWLSEKMLAGWADEVITVNASLATMLPSGRRGPPRIVANSPDPSVLGGRDVKDIRRNHGLEGFVVSYLGSLEPGRFVEEMVESAGAIPGLTLAIAGDGTLRPFVEKAAQSNPSVKFLGTLDSDEALRVTWASDLVIAMLDPSNPNYKVSTPVKVLDAMACGRPVVLSDGLNISESVKQIGCGFVISYDKAAFRAAIEDAKDSQSSLLTEMGRKGREFFDKELSWQRSESELYKAYEALTISQRS